MQTIEEMIAQYENFQAQKDLIALDKQALIDSVLTPEIKAKLLEIDTEFHDKEQAVIVNAERAEDELRAAVLAGGVTVKSGHTMAVWVKGRVSWDSKALDGMMILLPELAKARKEGAPSVTLRKV